MFPTEASLLQSVHVNETSFSPLPSSKTLELARGTEFFEGITFNEIKTCGQMKDP